MITGGNLGQKINTILFFSFSLILMFQIFMVIHSDFLKSARQKYFNIAVSKVIELRLFHESLKNPNIRKVMIELKTQT